MKATRPYVLSIAGFDPSAGAGILSDIKTFEANRVYGLGACSAITYQDDQHFEGLKWIPASEILLQVNAVLRKFPVACVKIGLIESLETALFLIREMKKIRPDILIVWDPILKASAGFEFHSKPNLAVLHELCAGLTLITPNIPEAVELGETGAAELNAAGLSAFCPVFLKGGHSEKKTGEDFLFLKNGKRISFGGRTFDIKPKHGSGCILSAAITARLAKGADLEKACLLGKEYALGVLESNESLLGYHAFETVNQPFN
jgi:hydroxymethylpyrimidine/phosphomethylpyrimidine kinase